MNIGAITGYIDVAQIALYVFWAFFAGLVYYLHRENKREGYPLESERSSNVRVQGFPAIPTPKTYILPHGGTVTVPNEKRSPQSLKAIVSANFLGAPIEPIGDPMLAGVGPGSWADRADTPDLTTEGTAKIVPLRVARDFSVAPQDTDPRGLPVVGADGKVAGYVHEVWVDRSEMVFRYMEVDLPNAAKGPHVLLPFNFARVGARQVKVRSLLAKHFADVPRLKHPDQVTLLEEEKIMAYFGAGTHYATAERSEPLL